MSIVEHWTEVPAEGGTMSIHVAKPSGDGPFPGVLSCHSFIGISDYRLDVSRRLAAKGYAVVLPDLFHRNGKRLLFPQPAKENDAVATAASLSFLRMAIDSRVAINHLKSQREVDAARIGVIGFGMGGTVAFVAACTNRDLKAAAIAYSRNLVPGALSLGRPISPLLMVDDIAAPMLFLSSNGDTSPSPSDVKVLEALMHKYKKSFEAHVYESDPPVGHAFMEKDIDQFYHPTASDWGWRHLDAFLERRLQGK